MSDEMAKSQVLLIKDIKDSLIG